MSTGTELVMLLRGRAPLAVAMTASAQPNKVLTPRTTVASSKSGVSGRNIMYFIRVCPTTLEVLRTGGAVRHKAQLIIRVCRSLAVGAPSPPAVDS